jgi:hypothetical protein
MSINLQYQGLPPGCGLIELVRSRTWGDGCWVSAVPRWLACGSSIRGVRIKPAPGQLSPYPGDPEAETIWAWCCEAIRRFPDLPERQLDVGKSYRWLPFALSAKVRKQSRWPKPAPTDSRSWNDPESGFDRLIELAFREVPQIAPGVCATQGVPVGLIGRTTANDLGLCLAAVELDEIRPWIAELVELGNIPAWDADRAMKLVSEFQRFFAEAAERGEDVLAVWD